MKNKYGLYLLILAVGSAIPAGIACVALQLLESVEDPAATKRSFLSLQSGMTWSVLATFVALCVIQGRAYLRHAATGWLFLCTWLYLLLFIAVDFWWLSQVFLQYKKDNAVWEGGFDISAVFGLLLLVLGALLCLGGYVRGRLRRRALKRASS